MMRRFEAPAMRASLTKSRSRTLRTSLRMSRAKRAHRMSEVAMTTVCTPGPITATRSSAARTSGNDIMPSAVRITKASNRPPK